MSFLKKVQNLSLVKRKIILWTLMLIIASGLIFLSGGNLQNRFRDFNKKSFINQLDFSGLKKEFSKTIENNKVSEIISNVNSAISNMTTTIATDTITATTTSGTTSMETTTEK
jgi:hypothetical protein